MVASLQIALAARDKTHKLTDDKDQKSEETNNNNLHIDIIAKSDSELNSNVNEITEQLALQTLGAPITLGIYPPAYYYHYPSAVSWQSPYSGLKGDFLINYSMELVWHGEFQRLFQCFYPHNWSLSPTFSLPRGRKWMMFKDSAKVRFLCKECSHGWTSMKGRVVFWFLLDETKGSGIVLFRLFGQRCKICSPPSFEHAMWYPEEVIKVVGNVFNRIGQEFYGFFRPTVRIDRRAGKPRAKHNTELCQACSEGICPGEFDSSVEPTQEVQAQRLSSVASSEPSSPGSNC